MLSSDEHRSPKTKYHSGNSYSAVINTPRCLQEPFSGRGFHLPWPLYKILAIFSVEILSYDLTRLPSSGLFFFVGGKINWGGWRRGLSYTDVHYMPIQETTQQRQRCWKFQSELSSSIFCLHLFLFQPDDSGCIYLKPLKCVCVSVVGFFFSLYQQGLFVLCNNYQEWSAVVTENMVASSVVWV